MGLTPYFGTHDFVWFRLLLMSTDSENLIYLALMVKKFKNLAASFEGEPPILILTNFVKFDLFVTFALSENFMCLA